MPPSFTEKSSNYVGDRLKPSPTNLLTTAMLLAWFVAPVTANVAEREGRLSIDTTDVRIVNSGSTNTLGFTLTLAENGTATFELIRPSRWQPFWHRATTAQRSRNSERQKDRAIH